MPKFLSDEWVAEARSIQQEYEGKGVPPAAQVKINLTITDVPADVAPGDIKARMDTSNGTVELDLDHFDQADAGLTVGYDTARAFIVDGNQQAMMQAFMQGKVKITGDMTKVLALQATGADPVAVEVAQRLKAISD
ncbi:MAG: SCP2 sterol-binding domain-containing protein [Acidimicrobiales bacterium]